MYAFIGSKCQLICLGCIVDILTDMFTVFTAKGKKKKKLD